MSRYTKINNPKTNEDHFGFIPEIPKLGTDGAYICLFEGEHSGPSKGGRGFGEAHVMAAHATDIKIAGCKSVAEYLALFLTQGTPVCYEGGYQSQLRTLAMRRSGVIIVLEYRQQRGGSVWSVVTAFKRPEALQAEELCKIAKAAPIQDAAPDHDADNSAAEEEK